MKRWIPLLILILLTIAFYFSGADRYLTFDQLRSHREAIVSFVKDRSILSPLLFIALTIGAAALSLPTLLFLVLLAGFLFELPFSLIYVVSGSTIGASILFLSARKAFLSLEAKVKVWPRVQKMKVSFHKSGAFYLLSLRLIPFIPFWFVNWAAAFFEVPFKTFLWTTFFGMTPGAFVGILAGSGLGKLLDSKEEVTWKTLLNPEIEIALMGLLVLSLVPILIKKFRKK